MDGELRVEAVADEQLGEVVELVLRENSWDGLGCCKKPQLEQLQKRVDRKGLTFYRIARDGENLGFGALVTDGGIPYYDLLADGALDFETGREASIALIRKFFERSGAPMIFFYASPDISHFVEPMTRYGFVEVQDTNAAENGDVLLMMERTRFESLVKQLAGIK